MDERRTIKLRDGRKLEAIMVPIEETELGRQIAIEYERDGEKGIELGLVEWHDVKGTGVAFTVLLVDGNRHGDSMSTGRKVAEVQRYNWDMFPELEFSASRFGINLVELPEKIKSEMRRWREIGDISFPKSYIEFHRFLANKHFTNLLRRDLITRIYHRGFEDDGWCDGMKAVVAVIEDKFGRLFKLVWNDSNQEFFAVHNSGGSSPFRFQFDSEGGAK